MKKTLLFSASILFSSPIFSATLSPQLTISDDWNASNNTYGLDVMFPVIHNLEKVPFINLRYFANNEDANSFSFGGGYRYLRNNNTYIGVNAYVDSGESEFSNHQWGGSIGLEWLAPKTTLSSNAYFPISQSDSINSMDYTILNNGHLGVATSTKMSQMPYGLDVHATHSVYESNNVNIKIATEGYWRKLEDNKSTGIKLKLDAHTKPTNNKSYLSIAPYIQFDNKKDTQFGIVLGLGTNLARQNLPNHAIVKNKVERSLLNTPYIYENYDFEQATNFENVQFIDISKDNDITSLNSKLAALGNNGISILSGKQTFTDSIILPDTQSVYGGDATIPIVTKSGKKGKYNIGRQPAEIHVSNTDADVIKAGSRTSLNNLKLTGGKNGISNILPNAENIRLNKIDISQVASDGLHFEHVNGINANNIHVHNLPICENNTLCEFSYFKPDHAPNAAFAAISSDNVNIKNSHFDNVTYGLFVTGRLADTGNWATTSNNINIDNMAINNTRRESVMLVGVDGAHINHLNINNHTNSISDKPDMDLVVLQASKNVVLKDANLKGGINGLMLVNAYGLPEVDENNFTFEEINISDTSRANIFLNPINNASFKNVHGDRAGTVGMFMMGNDFMGHVQNIKLENVNFNAPANAGIDVMGPLDDIEGDLNISNAPVACHQVSPWSPAVLTQSEGKELTINGEVINNFYNCT